MKKIYLLLLLLFPFIGLAQTTPTSTTDIQPDNRLTEVYGSDYINTLMSENPTLIQRWNYYLDHAFFITDDVPEKGATYPTITIENLEDINILKIEMEQKTERAWAVPKIYQIKNTNKVLIYLSGKAFNEQFRVFLKG